MRQAGGRASTVREVQGLCFSMVSMSRMLSNCDELDLVAIAAENFLSDPLQDLGSFNRKLPGDRCRMH